MPTGAQEPPRCVPDAFRRAASEVRTRPPRRTGPWRNLLALLLGVAVSLAAAEGLLHWCYPHDGLRAGVELPWMRGNPDDLSKVYTLDPETGFRPILGAGDYSAFGTLLNAYPATKRAGMTRVLFIGDSVTRRGKIVDALRAIHGEETFEYWNAGVESFGTVQEVAYYLRHNAAIEPDHVILTFHPNDFESTPVAFFDRDRRLVVYQPSAPLRTPSRRLFQASHLYRFLLGLTADRDRGRAAIAAEVRGAMQRLRDALRARGIRLSVVILPLMKPAAEWSPDERRALEQIRAITAELGIEAHDLLPALERAMAGGVDIHETPMDPWHPSAAVARVFARELAARGLLAPPPRAAEGREGDGR
ncbi:MAG: hypothetical protein HY897_12970 [Deltaproteobacteria bacterium]|nr:hypothetical protein [Deltaproteobacteria bacterium]